MVSLVVVLQGLLRRGVAVAVAVQFQRYVCYALFLLVGRASLISRMYPKYIQHFRERKWGLLFVVALFLGVGG